MSRSQLVRVGSGRDARLVFTRNVARLHPAEVEMPEGARPILPGSEGLVRIASRLTGGRFRLASVEIRDEAWRSSEENEELASIAQRLTEAIRAQDHRRIEEGLAVVSLGLAVESIELSEVETARRIRITRTGAVETQIANESEDRALIHMLEDSVNEFAR